MSDLILEKIKQEKRRRNQIYQSLDYTLSHLSYFDFFSKDAFQILLQAKQFASFYKKQTITSEILLLGFFGQKNTLRDFFMDFELDPNILSSLACQTNPIYEQYSQIKHYLYGKDFDNEQYKEKIGFHPEIKKIFEQATKNALSRFKTPIISSEILFITMMEDKTINASKIIKNMIEDEAKWYLIRYQLIKRIHEQESLIRGQISINQHYFACLLKRQLNDLELARLIEKQEFPIAVSLFRNTIVSSILTQDIFESILKDIKQSIRFTKFRKYSS